MKRTPRRSRPSGSATRSSRTQNARSALLEDQSISRSDIRSRIASRALTIGSWITIGHPSIAEIMAKAGFDWVVVDLEHSMIDLAQAAELIRTIDLCGVSPLVRLTSNDADQVKRVMDAGAHGIIVPMTNTADEARRAVAATRYAPRGVRGVGLSRAQGWGPGFQEYLSWQADGPVVIAQIEHRDGVANLEDILGVDGIDGLIIGPYDLSCSLGHPGEFEREDFLAAMDRIRATAKRLERPAGIHLVEPDPDRLEQLIAEGYTFIAYSVDFRILDQGVRQGLQRATGQRS